MQIFGPAAVTNAAQAIAHATSGASGTNGTNGTSGTNGSSSSSSSANSLNSLTSEQTFLQLLVAQIQNQDPLNPTDSIQFVGQLVQYSELSQLMGINQGVQTLTANSSTSTNGTSPTTNGSSS